MSRVARVRPSIGNMNGKSSFALLLGVVIFGLGCDGAHLDPVGLNATGGTSNTEAGAGGTEANGGVAATSGRDAAAESGGASGASTGGSAASTGGSDVSTGGSDVSTGGSDVSTGGSAATGGVDSGAPEPTTVKQIVAGERHTCVLLSDGQVKCWGLNDHGQLGSGNPNAIGDDETPAAVGTVQITSTPGITVLSLAAGWFHTCALLSDHTVKCWGWNDSGQLGYGHREDIGDDEVPASVGAISVTTTPGVTVKDIVAGHHTCALLSDGTVKCWGGGYLGYGNTEKIGDDELPSSVGPISITTTPGVITESLTSGFHHVCALLSDRSLKCWGNNSWGELGTGNPSPIGPVGVPSSIPPISVTTTPGVTVRAVQAGMYHTCALLSDGTVKCWGGGFNGTSGVGYGNKEPIGDDELPSSVGAVSLTTTAGVTAVGLASGISHTCALLSDGSVTCWGWNAHGQLGYGNEQIIGDDELPSSVGPASITVPPSASVKALSAGATAYNMCALLTDGSAKCWGLNLDGELGYATKDAVGDDELPSSMGSIVLF